VSPTPKLGPTTPAHTPSADHDQERTPNLLRRTDIAEQRTAEEKIYFCAIKNVLAGRTSAAPSTRECTPKNTG
jgi:hypothetical protein